MSDSTKRGSGSATRLGTSRRKFITKGAFGVGATAVVGGMFDGRGEQYTVWFPGRVWDGLATIIRQTPDHHRAAPFP